MPTASPGSIRRRRALEGGAPLPADTRLVLIHALNPFGAAWGRGENEDGHSLDRPGSEASWSFAMLRAVLTEDLARVTKLRVLELALASRTHVADANGGVLAGILKTFRPAADIRTARLSLAPDEALATGRAVVARALADL